MKQQVKKGDPIIIVIDSYGSIYEGIATIDDDGEDAVYDNNIIFAEPHGWTIGTKELRKITEKELLNSNIFIGSKRISNAVGKKGYVWVAMARLVKNGKNVRIK